MKLNIDVKKLDKVKAEMKRRKAEGESYMTVSSMVPIKLQDSKGHQVVINYVMLKAFMNRLHSIKALEAEIWTTDEGFWNGPPSRMALRYSLPSGKGTLILHEVANEFQKVKYTPIIKLEEIAV